MIKLIQILLILIIGLKPLFATEQVSDILLYNRVELDLSIDAPSPLEFYAIFHHRCKFVKTK